MQRTIKKSLLFGIIVSAIWSSCNKQLDIIPEGAPTKVNFWKTEADAISASNALYALYDQSESFYGRGLFWFINASDDMVTGRANAQGDNMKNFSWAYIGGSYTENNWVDRFTVIKRKMKLNP